MSDYNIAGIQQIGIGVSNADDACKWYAKHFGMDLPIFSDEAEASLMFNYTGGQIHKRKAILTMNLQGGGGFEIWQFTSREPSGRAVETKEGDLGITHIHLRTCAVEKAYNYFQKLENVKLSKLKDNDLKKRFFELSDPYGNKFKIIEDDYQFIKTTSLIGGVIGATIGVSKLNKSLKLYQGALKYDQLLSKKIGDNKLETAWLAPSNIQASAFGDWLGSTRLELVCDTQNKRERIFENRFWGDLGFIHICFDVQRMNSLREQCALLKHPFTVDSDNSFDMGEAAGQFAYVEDNDQTLIELVETHKVPIIKKLGLYVNLKKKKVQKPLPKIIFKILGMNRIKPD